MTRVTTVYPFGYCPTTGGGWGSGPQRHRDLVVIAGSDKRLGTAADSAAIKALVPSTPPVTIRWVSRSLVVIAADCSSGTSFSGRLSCLYVLEKHRSKWKITHHYFHHGISSF